MADGKRAALNMQTIRHFSVDKGIKIISWGQEFLYIKESYQQLRKQSLLVTQFARICRSKETG